MRPIKERREMRRVGDTLPEVAAALGIDAQLRFARQMSAWQRLVEEHVPAASGASSLLAVQAPALLVSATNAMVAQELRLRQMELLAAFGQAPEGVHMLELRVVIRPDGGTSGQHDGRPGGRSGGR